MTEVEERVDLARKTEISTFKEAEKWADYILEAEKTRSILNPSRMKTINHNEVILNIAPGKALGMDDTHVVTSKSKSAQTLLYPEAKQAYPKDPTTLAITEAVDQLLAKGMTNHDKLVISLNKDRYSTKIETKQPKKERYFPNSEYEITGKITVNEQTGEVKSTESISLMNHEHVRKLLKNYSEFAEIITSPEANHTDIYFLLLELVDAVEQVFGHDNQLREVVNTRLMGCSLEEAIEHLHNKYEDFNYTDEYVMKLWNKRIPRMIVEYEEQKYFDWWWKVNDKPLKKCSRCQQMLPHNVRYFSPRSSADPSALYSICRNCRSVKK